MGLIRFVVAYPSNSFRPAMVAMKAMKAKNSGGLTQTGVYQAVAEKTGLKSKDVKAAVAGVVEVAMSQVKKAGRFNFAGMMTMKLKNKPATKARKGFNPFTKEPCVFKAKPA